MTDSKRRFKTIIAGKTYTIVGNKSADHLTAVSGLVNKQLDQIKEAAPTLGAEERGILVAVNAISDQITKQLEIEELKANIAALEEELKEAKTQKTATDAVAETQPQPEIANEEHEGETAIVADAPRNASEQGNKAEGAKTATEPEAKTSQKLKQAKQRKRMRPQQVKPIKSARTEGIAATPATVTELRQAARSAVQIQPSVASVPNSKLSRTTTASEAALKKAQQSSNVLASRAIRQDNDKNMPPYTKNKMKNDNKQNENDSRN